MSERLRLNWWKVAGIIVAIHGTFCLLGGWVGYYRAGSVISAAAGSLAFLILIPAAVGLWHEHRASAYVALTVSLILDARFIYAYALDHKMMPHLTMIILSSISATAAGTVLLLKFFSKHRHKKS